MVIYMVKSKGPRTEPRGMPPEFSHGTDTHIFVNVVGSSWSYKQVNTRGVQSTRVL